MFQMKKDSTSQKRHFISKLLRGFYEQQRLKIKKREKIERKTSIFDY